MLRVDKLYSALKKESLLYAILALVSAFVFWYQSSPISLSQYRDSCGPDKGNATYHNRCMDTYWSQYDLDKIGLIISLGLVGVFIVLFIMDQMSRKEP